MTTTETTEAAVESLCGDLSRIRAPRGPDLNARSWSTEAPLRMLLNNLDPEVAEHPEALVVYGGSGRAARSHDALKAIVRTLLRLGDDETLLVQSGKPVGVFRTHAGSAARPDRQRDARPALGHLGRVPPAGGTRPDHVRPDDGWELDLHRHAGNPPGHVPDLRGRGREALRRRRPRRALDPHCRAGGMGGAQPLAGVDAERRRPLRRGRSRQDRAAAGDPLPRRGGRLPRRRALAHPRGSTATGAASRSDCSATQPRSCRSWRDAARRSTSSPTRRRRTTR